MIFKIFIIEWLRIYLLSKNHTKKESKPSFYEINKVQISVIQFFNFFNKKKRKKIIENAFL